MDLYMNNINLIEFFRRTLIELKKYNISCEVYEQELNEIIKNYETQKEKALKRNNEIVLTTNYDNQLEIILFTKLSMLKSKLSDHILFLQLIDATKDWNLNNDIEELLIKIKNEKIVDSFSDIKTQKLILEKHSDLLLKKFLKDMENEDKCLLEKNNNLEEHPLLKNSLSRYIHDKQINIDITNNLEETLEKIKKYFQTEKKEEVLTGDVITNKESLFKKIAKKFRKPNLNLVYLGSAKDEVLERIGIEKAEKKDFTDCDLRGINLFDVDFTDAILINTILTNTNARIDPAKVVSLYNSNLAGCYVLNNFDDYESDMPKLQGAIIVDDFDEDIPFEEFSYQGEINKVEPTVDNMDNQKLQVTYEINEITIRKNLIEERLEIETDEYEYNFSTIKSYDFYTFSTLHITLIISIIEAIVLGILIHPMALVLSFYVNLAIIPLIAKKLDKKKLVHNYNALERKLNKELSNLNKKQKELVKELKKLTEIKDEKNDAIDKQAEKRELLQNYSSLLQEAKNHTQIDKYQELLKEAKRHLQINEPENNEKSLKRVKKKDV